LKVEGFFPHEFLNYLSYHFTSKSVTELHSVAITTIRVTTVIVIM